LGEADFLVAEGAAGEGAAGVQRHSNHQPNDMVMPGNDERYTAEGAVSWRCIC
jgi:hypothetical protein